MAKTKPLGFNKKLVLNQWLIEQCGFPSLPLYKNETQKSYPLEDIANILRKCPEGMGTDNRHKFYKALEVHWPENAKITKDDLSRYEENIASHTEAINKNRPNPIIWKYHQWLSLLFVEIYLDRYFNRREELLENLNNYIQRFNAHWKEKGLETGVKPYIASELNKICLQNATGSGKTLLMHVNFLQFSHYTDESHLKNDLTNTILITPNESLSEQHVREMKASGINAKRLSAEGGDLFSFGTINFTETTKLSDESGLTQIAIRDLGNQNLLFVDEAHRGVARKEEKGWFRNREKLVERGFVFEYSATFKEALTAAKEPEIEAAYAKNILFDYSYRYFYEDGYGKDYRIFNLPKSYDEQRTNYLIACLLSFYQQLKLYEDNKSTWSHYNLEKPLWVFVGKSVSKTTVSQKVPQEEKKTISDIALTLQFIAHILKDSKALADTIKNILDTNAKNTGLLDNNDHDILAGSFSYIRELLSHKKWTIDDLQRDILNKVFLNAGGGELTLAKIKGDDSEVMLRVGQQETPFGLINVGDAVSLIKHIEDEKKNNPEEFSNINLQEAEFSDPLFSRVHESSSSITFLLGAKKFIEGWDCWRVSTLGLMHVGKKEGTQIIQLFGRGVRLKGYEWALKRSEFVAPTGEQPNHIKYLETLNVFGVQADFMEKFKKFLEEEGLPGNDQIETHEIPIEVTHGFNKNLKVLRPRRKNKDGREYNFKKDAKIPSFGALPDKFPKKPVIIDWYSRIQTLESKPKEKKGDKNNATFSSEQLAFLDYDKLFFSLEKFKRERKWHNFNISKSEIRTLLEDGTWYEMLVPEQNMKQNDVKNIQLWQKMADALLRKYCEELYNYSKSAFIKPRLELRPITADDENIPQEKKYQLTIKTKDEASKNNIKDLKDELLEEGDSSHRKHVVQKGDIKAYLFEEHLYKPILHANQNSKIQISPTALNDSEAQFVEDLQEYLKRKKEGEEEFYLLRNESRGKGIGFFEAGNFYPDFILWKLKADFQYIAFIEPHGLIHENPESDKINFYKTIKEIQERLSVDKVYLNSFIVTPTGYREQWGMSIDALAEKNVYFMKDKSNSYISSIILSMEKRELA